MPRRNPVTRDDLRRAVGEIDELVASELLASGASLDDLIEKVRELEAENDDDEYAD